MGNKQVKQEQHDDYEDDDDDSANNSNIDSDSPAHDLAKEGDPLYRVRTMLIDELSARNKPLGVSLLVDAPGDSNAFARMLIEDDMDVFTKSNGLEPNRRCSLFDMYQVTLTSGVSYCNNDAQQRREIATLTNLVTNAKTQMLLVNLLTRHLEQVEACKRMQNARSSHTSVTSTADYNTIMSTSHNDLQQWAEAEIAARTNVLCNSDSDIIVTQNPSAVVDPRYTAAQLRLLYNASDARPALGNNTDFAVREPLWNGNVDNRAQVEVFEHGAQMNAIYQRAMDVSSVRASADTLMRMCRMIDLCNDNSALAHTDTLPVVILFGEQYHSLYKEAWSGELLSSVYSDDTAREAMCQNMARMCSVTNSLLVDYANRIDHHALLVILIDTDIPQHLQQALNTRALVAEATARMLDSKTYRSSAGLANLNSSSLVDMFLPLREVIINTVSLMLVRMATTEAFSKRALPALKALRYSVRTTNGFSVEYREFSQRHLRVTVRSCATPSHSRSNNNAIAASRDPTATTHSITPAHVVSLTYADTPTLPTPPLLVTSTSNDFNPRSSMSAAAAAAAAQ